MKVIICTYFNLCVPSAQLNRLMRMAESLEAYGISVTIVGTSKDVKLGFVRDCVSRVSMIYFGDPANGWLRYMDTLNSDQNAARFYRRYLSDIIKDGGFDAAIFYGVLFHSGNAVLSTCRHANVPLFVDLVEWFDWSPRRVLNGLNLSQAAFLSKVVPKASGVIAISLFWQEWARKRRLPSVWIPSFGKLPNIWRTAPSSSNPALSLCFLGHWVDREMPLYLLTALDNCIRAGVYISLEVLGNVGGHPQEKRYLAYVNRNPALRKRISFSGFVPESLKEEKLALADAFVLLRPNTRETHCLFPTRLPEYLLAGNATILSHAGCFPDCFSHRKDVWFVSNEQLVGSLTDALLHLNANRDELFRIGQQGRRTALAMFSQEVLGERISTFFKGIIKNRTSLSHG